MERVPIGTEVCMTAVAPYGVKWGHATVTADFWPNDPNYEVTYPDGGTGQFTRLRVECFCNVPASR